MQDQQRHILMISNYFAPDAGAAAVRNTRLAHELHRMGHQVTVLTSLPHYPQGHIHDGYRGKAVVVENRDGIRVVQTWLWATKSTKISYKLLSQISFMLTAIVRGMFLKRPDVILIEAQPVFTGIGGRVIALFKRRPYVLNVSDLWPEHLLSVGALKEESMIYRIARFIVNHLYRRASHIIAMSPAWATRIHAQIADATPVEVVLNGVDLQRFHPDVDTSSFREKHGLNDKKILLFLGTFATQYDFDLMFEAVAGFKNRDDVQVVFIGQGSQRDSVEAYLQKSQFAHVRRIEWIPHDETPAAWNSAWLTFWAMRPHPLYEGTIPAKFFEAMACGIPIVVYSRGVMVDLLTESQSGRILSDGGAEALFTAMQTIVDNHELRQQLAQSARQYAETNFEHTTVAHRYETILLEAIS